MYANTVLIVFIMSILSIIYIMAAKDIKVTIIPSGAIVKRINEDLNLTCRIKTEDRHNYTLKWNFPTKSNFENSRFTIYKKDYEITVRIHRLQKDDSGDYICEVKGKNSSLERSVTISVRGKENCSDAFFKCDVGMCIAHRYVCDGFYDCKNGNDENASTCGKDPCEGKILCDDGRCIHKRMCCDQLIDPDCPVLYKVPCCHKLLNKEQVSSIIPMQQHHYNDINFLQSTIYTIVSCAIAFIFITTIMVVAICRIHMRRSVMSLSSQRSNRRLPRWPWYLSRLRRRENRESDSSWQTRCQVIYPNLDNEETLLDGHRIQAVPYSCSLSTHGSFIITYSNSDGIQLIEHLPKPPPYTETSNVEVHLPSCETNAIPPPPYQSVEDLPASSGSQTNLSPPEINSAENDQVIVIHMTSSNVPSLRLEENSQ